MPTINLTANGRDQEPILAYLQENASDTLADKINNGVPFEKDGKQLINRKDLDGFMKFACDEARKLAAKGSNSACVEDSVVYGWSIHYFEEDSIQGKLFNPDGTEYTPAPCRKVETPKSVAKPTPPKPKTQFSFFDMLNEKKDGQKTEITEQTDDCEAIDNAKKDPSVEEIADALQQAVEQKHAEKIIPPTPRPKPKNDLYEKYSKYASRYPDSVIAMRVGDFYEILGKNAVSLAEELNMTLTSRDLGLEQRMPMIGFPYHAAEVYFKKLRQKHSIVVVDPDGERKLDEFGIEDVIDGDNELTEDEMRLFDGDISEPKEVATETTKEQSNDDCPYDEIALAKVVKLLGDSFILR